MTEARFFELIKALEKVNDIIVRTKGNEMDITINDFDGFDDNWHELDREFVEPEMVDELEEFLDEVCDGDFYLYGEAFGYEICVGTTSMDI